MKEESSITKYRHRIRILLIIFYFSETGSNKAFAKLLKGEVRIQKIDFLVRYPDYFAHELLELAENDKGKYPEIKGIVSNIFQSEEPQIRKVEMERFFFGAWESIDDTISFLMARGLIFFESKKHTDGKVGQKHYYLTHLGEKKVNQGLTSLPTLQWYIERCELINTYFGDLSGKELSLNQYKHPEYKNTPFKDFISGIENKVKNKFYQLYKVQL